MELRPSTLLFHVAYDVITTLPVIHHRVPDYLPVNMLKNAITGMVLSFRVPL